jgi:hypothetical protein
MIPCVRSNANDNIITCNADLIISNDNYPLLISLVDLAIKNKKICADIINDKFWGVELKDREDINFSEHIYTSNLKYRFKSEPMGELSHTIIYNTNIKNYAIDWINEGKCNIITNF